MNRGLLRDWHPWRRRSPPRAQEISHRAASFDGLPPIQRDGDDKLQEKHAAALGLKDVKIAWSTYNGPNAMNDALTSDSVDIVSGRRARTAHAVEPHQGHAERGAGHLGAFLAAVPAQYSQSTTSSRSPTSRTQDRIAVPAMKVSVQAMPLQMAPAKLHLAGQLRQVRRAHGVDVAARCDHRAALRLGRDHQRVQRSAVPFQQLEKPGIRTILNSFDIIDGPHTSRSRGPRPRFRGQEPGALQGADRGAEGGDRDHGQGPQEGSENIWIEE